MDYFDFDGESVFLGLLFGVAIGVAGMTAFIEWVRCENCCQHSDEPDYWIKRLGRRKEDRE